jgi:hypothetical protein
LKALRRGWFYWVALIVAVTPSNLHSTQPIISYIERYSAGGVLIHFDTDPDRTYLLQYTDSLSRTNWSNLYTGHSYPFSEHYVILDQPTNSVRFYRLKVTP